MSISTATNSRVPQPTNFRRDAQLSALDTGRLGVIAALATGHIHHPGPRDESGPGAVSWGLAAERRGLLRRVGMGKDGQNAVRITTTFNRQQHGELERLAKQHDVKVAWLVRYATQRLIDEANRGTLPLDFGMGDQHA